MKPLEILSLEKKTRLKLMNPEGYSSAFLHSVAQDVVSSGEAWISATVLGENIPALRACSTNFRTEPEDILALTDSLHIAREKFSRRT